MKTLCKAGILLTGLLLTSCSSDNNAPSVAIQSNPSQTEVTPNVANSTTAVTVDPSGTTMITEEEARAIALEHAGLTESEVVFLKTWFEYDNGVPEYEVEFYKDNMEYDYEIHGSTGAIIGYDSEMETPRGSNSTGDIVITEAQAKAIALEHARLEESEVSFVLVKVDYDKGIAEYEVEFYADNMEYDYEINATTGDILSYDHEMETTRPTSGTTTGTANTGTTTATGATFTEAEAKEIALAHAGFTEAQVNYIVVKMDYDKGVPEYEVEFYVNNQEYDYEINGNTGDIIGYDFDMESVYSGASNNNSTEAMIGEVEAKSIALNHAGLEESAVTGMKVKFDYDDGVPEYEVEFYNGRIEYEYEIHGSTGAVLSYDMD